MATAELAGPSTTAWLAGGTDNLPHLERQALGAWSVCLDRRGTAIPLSAGMCVRAQCPSAWKGEA